MFRAPLSSHAATLGTDSGMKNQSLPVGERTYLFAIDGNVTVCDESVLMAAWAKSLPDLALRVRSLARGEATLLFRGPKIVVARIR